MTKLNGGKEKYVPKTKATVIIKADENVVFSYAAPKSGWWGFAALNEADFKLKTISGEAKGIELGAVIWVHFEDWQQK
jgi:cobalt/nickel transport protein